MAKIVYNVVAFHTSIGQDQGLPNIEGVYNFAYVWEGRVGVGMGYDLMWVC